MELDVRSSAPPGSGLGGSSSVTAAIIGVVAAYTGQALDCYEQAELNFQVERHDLGIEGGKQDQYATTFGGFNVIEFYLDAAIVNSLELDRDTINDLESHLLLCYTGRVRTNLGLVSNQVRLYREGREATHHGDGAAARAGLRDGGSRHRGQAQRFRSAPRTRRICTRSGSIPRSRRGRSPTSCTPRRGARCTRRQVAGRRRGRLPVALLRDRPSAGSSAGAPAPGRDRDGFRVRDAGASRSGGARIAEPAGGERRGRSHCNDPRRRPGHPPPWRAARHPQGPGPGVRTTVPEPTCWTSSRTRASARSCSAPAIGPTRSSRPSARDTKTSQLHYSIEPRPLGTAGALRLAISRFDAERYLVLNGDSYIHCSLDGFDRWHRTRESSFPGSLLLTWAEDTSRFGTVKLGSARRDPVVSGEVAGSRVRMDQHRCLLAPAILARIDQPGSKISIETREVPAMDRRRARGLRHPRPVRRYRHAGVVRGGRDLHGGGPVASSRSPEISLISV